MTPGQPQPVGYLAKPKANKGRGVLVLHPWWGLNADVKAYCDRLAEAGFVAFAPDLFGGKTATTQEGAKALTKEHDAKAPQLMVQIREAAKYLGDMTGKPEIGVVGFSFGGYYALEFSNTEPSRVRAVVAYYGLGHEEFGASKAAYLGHFAEKDDFESKESVDALEKLLKDAGRPVTVHTYPETKHWFAEPSVAEAYDKAASELAFERTVAFLRGQLPG